MKISIKKKLFPIDKKGKPPYMPVNKGYGYLGVLLYEPIRKIHTYFWVFQKKGNARELLELASYGHL